MGVKHQLSRRLAYYFGSKAACTIDHAATTSSLTASASAATTFLRPRFGEPFVRAAAGCSSAKLASASSASGPTMRFEPELAYACVHRYWIAKARWPCHVQDWSSASVLQVPESSVLGQAVNIARLGGGLQASSDTYLSWAGCASIGCLILHEHAALGMGIQQLPQQHPGASEGRRGMELPCARQKGLSGTHYAEHATAADTYHWRCCFVAGRRGSTGGGWFWSSVVLTIGCVIVHEVCRRRRRRLGARFLGVARCVGAVGRCLPQPFETALSVGRRCLDCKQQQHRNGNLEAGFSGVPLLRWRPSPWAGSSDEQPDGIRERTSAGTLLLSRSSLKGAAPSACSAAVWPGPAASLSAASATGCVLAVRLLPLALAAGDEAALAPPAGLDD